MKEIMCKNYICKHAVNIYTLQDSLHANAIMQPLHTNQLIAAIRKLPGVGEGSKASWSLSVAQRGEKE